MAYNYQLLPEAEVDLDEAVTWYGDKTPSVAQRFLNQFAHPIDRITTNPEQFSVAKGEIRKARFSGTFSLFSLLCCQGRHDTGYICFSRQANPCYLEKTYLGLSPHYPLHIEVSQQTFCFQS